MNYTDAIALVALIISIVALFIAVLQTGLSAFLTADGARRCRPSIIGKWSKLTKWHWNLSELRYEIKFTTPEIRLVPLDSAFPNTDSAHFQIFSAGDQIKDKEGWHVLCNDTLPHKIEFLWDKNMQKLAGSEKVKTAWKKMTKNQDYYDSAAMVTWDTFLRMSFLYQQHTQWLRRCALAFTQSKSQYQGGDAIITVQEATPHEKSQSLSGHTVVAIALRQYTWDVMPPDVVRPLARTNLGTILVLAQRLGLRWKEITLVPGGLSLRAEGNGLNISSTTVPALGTVLRFNRGTAGEAPQLVSNETADKMLCGILPGCRELGISDFVVIDNRGEKKGLKKMFKLLDLCPEAYAAIEETPKWFYLRMVVNEVVALLCPFMPSENSPVSRIVYPIAWQKAAPWKEGGLGYALTSFQFWEGRKTYLLALEQRLLQVEQLPSSKIATIAKARDLFRRLSRGTNANDFYCRWRRANIKVKIPTQQAVRDAEPRNEGFLACQEELQRTTDMLKDLKSIFDETTDYFKARNQLYLDEEDAAYQFRESEKAQGTGLALSHEDEDTDEDDDSILQTSTDNAKLRSEARKILNYGDLVRAHIDMIAQTLHKIQPKHGGGEQDWPKPSAELRAGKATKERGRHVHRAMAEFARLFVERKQIVIDRLKQLGQKKEHKGYETNELELEGAWWMLLVRGITWRMSVSIEKPDPDAMVPGEFYGSEIPLWIS